MIELLVYENRTFSKIDFSPLKNFKLNIQSKSKIAIDLHKVFELTCCKFDLSRSIYNLKGEDKTREEFLINKLKTQCKEVPVIRCRNFDNAAYIPDLDKLWKLYTDRDKKEFINVLGCNAEELNSKMGPHLVLFGDSVANAAVLAHEFGHYLNTIGSGEDKGKRVHEKYSSSKNKSDKSKYASILSSGVAVAELIAGSYDTSGIIFLSGAGFNGLSALYGQTVIVAETCASTIALKNLKLAGATDDELREYKESLVYALGTYKTYFRKFNTVSGLANTAAGIITLLI